MRRGGDGDDLKKRLFGSDHAKIGSGAFLSGFRALLEIHDFGIKCLIAASLSVVLYTLLYHGSTQIARLAKSFSGEPQLTLQRQRGSSQYDQHPT